MDQVIKKWLIIIAAAFLAAIAFYYVVSPYQNCVREGYESSSCIRSTTW